MSTRGRPVPQAFPSRAAFRTWLSKHHAQEKELLVRCFKAQAQERGLTYREALDEALCFGWIDGVRRRVDEHSFSVRFSPRKPKSKWSAVNMRRVRELQKERRMHPAGEKAFAGHQKTAYSYESRPQALSAELVEQFRAQHKAWRYFEQQAPWYRRTCSFWIMSAKRPETRERRLRVLIDHCARGKAIPPLDR